MCSLRVSMDSLALEGGIAVRTRPWPQWPHFEPEDLSAVADVLASGRVNYWTGEHGHRFEEEFARFTGSTHAVAVANGTLALETALYALGVGPGDEVIVPARTFFACAGSVAMRGARPVFADIDPASQNITAASIYPLFTERTRAVMAVHLQGWPSEVDEITALTWKQGISLIEDCSHAHGAEYRGRPVGSFGKIGVFSFCQEKIMTTGGEGGMLVTNDEDMWRRMWAYKDHGKSYDLTHTGEPAGSFRWVHEHFGTNARLTEMQSALGRKMLARLPENVRKRRENAGILREALSSVRGLRLPEPPGHVTHSYYKFYGFLEPERLKDGWTRDRVAEAIRAEGVPCSPGICGELYRERAIPAEWRPAKPLPVARLLGETSLMLQVHPTVDRDDLLDTAEAVRKVLSHACL